jgi:transcriptional regulator with XRE-family HTH domain
MLDENQRRLLGQFIRTHRERLRPPLNGGRRRTPGLRREELAAIAGISTTWCAWIEQGRSVQAAPETLGRLAHALRLSGPERAYLFKLADRLDPEAPCGEADDIPLSVKTLVSSLDCPAYGLDRLWNARCWNAPAERLFRPWLSGVERNLLRFVFLAPQAKELLPDWSVRARRLLAEFRADYGRNFRDEAVKNLIAGLRAESSEFSHAWDEQDVHERTGGFRRFDHKEDGALTHLQHTFLPADRPDYKIVILSAVPKDAGGTAPGPRPG